MIRGRNSNVMLPSYLKAVYDELRREEERLSEIENGEVLNLKEIRKMIGGVGDVLGVKKKKKVGDDVIDDLNFQSVLVEKAVEGAVWKARTLLTQKKEVLKTEKKTDANEIVLVALEGRSGEVLRRILDATS